MKVLINETNEIKELNYHSDNGVNWVIDFIGNYDALNDGQFTYDEETGVYKADQGTFDWWETVITDQIKTEERIQELKEKYDAEEVDRVVNAAADVDLEDLAGAINKALDDEFEGK